MKYPECEQCGKWSPRLAFVGNASISVFKFIVGYLTGSKGLMADAIHSVADATSSFFILIALRIAGKPKDKDHPFGHGKVEYISTIFASFFIFFCAVAIFVDSLHTFKNGVQRVPDHAAILATVISLIYSYLMYSSNKCAGTQMNSPALLADAEESRADSLSSVAVLVGLVGTQVGFIHADAIAAVVVALMVFRISVEMFFKGVHGLIDSSMEKEALDNIVRHCKAIPGVEGISSIRSRCMGQKCHVDIAIEVANDETVLSVHRIKEEVKATVNGTVEGVDDVFVKANPVSKWRLW